MAPGMNIRFLDLERSEQNARPVTWGMDPAHEASLCKQIHRRLCRQIHRRLIFNQPQRLSQPQPHHLLRLPRNCWEWPSQEAPGCGTVRRRWLFLSWYLSSPWDTEGGRYFRKNFPRGPSDAIEASECRKRSKGSLGPLVWKECQR